MAQNWLGLCDENLTELKNHNKYQLGNATSTIVYWDNWNDVGNNFVCYMPSSGSFICGRPAIRFHDCYKASDGKGYAHASFAFRAPGYIAGFPIDFGFASVNQSGTLSVIGQKQVYTATPEGSGTETYWNSTFETSFTWPTVPTGIIPFIAVGGMEFTKRFNGTNQSTSVSYFTSWNPNSTAKSTYKTACPSRNISAISGRDDIASNLFPMSYNSGWGAKVLCPVVFSNWHGDASTTFIGGWKNRGANYNSYLGAGFFFCGGTKADCTSWPSFSSAPYKVSSKIWVYNSAGTPLSAKNIYVYNSSGVPQKAKAVYRYNSSGVPVKIY